MTKKSLITKEVVLIDEHANMSGNGSVKFVNPLQCINGKKELGDNHVGVVVYNVEKDHSMKLHNLIQCSIH